MIAELLALAPVAALELAAGGTVLAANEPALELFGCAREDLVGRPLEPLVALGGLLSHEAVHAHSRVDARRANGVPLLVEASIRRLDAGQERRTLCFLRELSFDVLASEAQRYFDAAF